MAGRFIYVISQAITGRQKVGISNDPNDRIRNLQTGSPFPLSFAFVGLTDNVAKAIEDEVHILLDQHRQVGEWFDVRPEVAIAAVLATASRMGYSIKPVDPDNLPAVANITDTLISTATSWKIWAAGMLIFFAMLALTGHFLTAMIVSVAVAKLAEVSVRHLMPQLPAIKAAIARHNLRRSSPSATRALRISR